MDKDYFRYVCSTQKKTFDDVAKALGINVSTLYRKMSGESDFTRNEIQIIRDALYLSITDVEKIFFAA